MSVIIFEVFVGEGVESGFGGAVWGGEVYHIWSYIAFFG